MHLRRLRSLLLSTAGALAAGCGSSANGNFLDVGQDDAGGLTLSGDAATAATGIDAQIERNGIAVTFTTVSCAGACADVEAVATGGTPPYGFTWDDGTTTAARSLCPTKDTAYSVEVTDTPTSGEFGHAARTAKASLTADLLACPDAAAPVSCDAGTVATAIVPGRYLGTVMCPPDGGVVGLPTGDGGDNSGTITLDLVTQGGALSGHLSFLWSIGGTIVVQASLATPVCAGGALQLDWVNGQWGTPATAADGGISIGILGGTATGDITVAPAAGPNAIAGNFDYVVSTGSCLGTFTAALQP